VDIDALYATVLTALPLLLAAFPLASASPSALARGPVAQPVPLRLMLVQAEPAPHPAAPAPAPVPAPAPRPPAAIEAPPEPPATALGVALGGVYRLPPAGQDAPPALGPALMAFVGRRYALVGEQLALGLAAAFAFEQHTQTLEGAPGGPPGQAQTFAAGTRRLTFGDFVVLQTLALAPTASRLRPWLGAGGGLSLAHFTTPEQAFRPGEQRATLIVLHGVAGLDLEVAPHTDVGLRIDGTLPLSPPAFTTDKGERVHLFGTRLGARLGVQYRF
jgi:hypothetical protein